MRVFPVVRLARRLLFPRRIILSRKEALVPSVNVVQPIEPRLPAPPAASNRGGEPFAELLDSAVSHHEPKQPDVRPERPDASTPTSRSKLRTDSIARGEKPERPQPSRTEAKADPVEEPGKMPEPTGESEATQIEQAAAEPAPERDGEIKPSEAQKSAEAVSAPVAGDAEGDAEGDGSEATTIVNADAPAAEPQAEVSMTATTTVKTDAVTAPNLAVTAPNLEVKTDAFIAPTVEVESETAPVAGQASQEEPETQPSSAGLKQVLTAVTPVAAAPTDDAQTVDALPVLPSNAVNAMPAPDQATLPQSNVATAAPAPVIDTAAKPASRVDLEVVQQPDAPQVTDPKPIKAATTPVADNPTPPPPAPDAPKINASAPVPMPEPVRALASSLNAASLHAANVNEPNPVPLKGIALAVEIVSRMRDGMRRFEIRLDPPELGRIDVRLEVDRHGQATTKLTVDRPETLDLLQREARGLERALQQAGLKTDQGGLEFSLRQQAPDGQVYDQSGRSQRQPELVAGEDNEISEAVIESYRATASARGGVDIKV
jgi:flagellar hook-length control protein FliK